MYYEPCNTTTNIDNNMYNSTNGVDCQRHIDCESSQADQAVRNPASSTKTKPSDIQMDETDSTMNSQRDQAYILSFDGINLTQEAVQALQAENENISSDAGSGEFPNRLSAFTFAHNGPKNNHSYHRSFSHCAFEFPPFY